MASMKKEEKSLSLPNVGENLPTTQRVFTNAVMNDVTTAVRKSLELYKMNIDSCDHNILDACSALSKVDDKVARAEGYKGLRDYVSNEFGLSYSQSSYMVKVSRLFDIEGNITVHPAVGEFSFSQLCKLVSLNGEDLEKVVKTVSPEMSCKAIGDAVVSYKEENGLARKPRKTATTYAFTFKGVEGARDEIKTATLDEIVKFLESAMSATYVAKPIKEDGGVRVFFETSDEVGVAHGMVITDPVGCPVSDPDETEESTEIEGQCEVEG